MDNLVKKMIKRFYHGLPVVRELRSLEKNLTKTWPSRLQRIEAAVVFQALETLKAGNERYRDPKRLMAHGAQYWSQNYEDGMIAEIFRRIGTRAKTFLEIGTGDGSENNTTALLAAGWSGWWIEGSSEACASITARLGVMPELATRLKLRQALVARENISNLLAELGIPPEVDLFSLDIDLNTYHIWAALKDFRPRVVVVEYNAGLPPGQYWIHPYEPENVWDITQAQGASLKAYERLGCQFGYSLVGCDITGVNAFFVRSDLAMNQFSEPFTAENHYEPPRHFLTYRFGHPSKFYGQTHRDV